MAETVSFKVCLRNSEEQTDSEVRRFEMDRGESRSFSNLQEKLCMVYPPLSSEIFNVMWTDDENDSVTISTDDELIIALTEMTGPVYKINVQVTGIKENVGTNANGDVHLGVVCDGCDKAVAGFRYKCQVCQDFDLCGVCEASGLHPEHNMTKIARPRQKPFANFAQPLHSEQRNSCHSSSHRVNMPLPGIFGILEGLVRVAGDHEESGTCHRGPYSNGQLFGKRCRNGKKPCKETKSGEKDTKDIPVKEQKKKTNSGEEKKENASLEGQNNENNKSNKESVTQKSPTEKMINNFLEAAVGNLGDDVQVPSEDIENVGKFVSNILSVFNIESDTDEKKNETEDKINDQEIAKEVKNNVAPEKENAATPNTEEEEWTIVKDDDQDQVSSSNMYPSLDEVTPSVTSPVPTDATTNIPTLHSAPADVSDPKIQVALQAMINMGFTNEGGWLENLLETKEADIGKVLDVLKPNNK